MPKPSHYKVLSPTVSVSYCCCNKLPQTWWLLTVPGLKSEISFIGLKSDCHQGHAPSGGSRGHPFLASSCCTLHCLACGSFLHLQSQHLSTLLQAYSLCLAVAKSSSVLHLIKMLVLTFRIHSGNPGYSFQCKILTLIISTKSLCHVR